MAVPSYALEHFYHGQVVSGGRLQGDLRLLAQSPGVHNDHVAEAVRLARIPAPGGSPQGSWALVRGESVPFFIVQAVMGNGGQPLRHVILVPVDVLRTIGGNVRALTALLLPQLPLFSTTGHTLPLLSLPQRPHQTAEAQESAMLSLLSAVHDRLENLEALLAAIIQGVPIIVEHAPDDLDRRLAFIEGLLALLPPPARFGVTFATYATTVNPVETQVRFLADNDAAPPNTMVLDWASGRISGTSAEADYARFIKSQLRLGTERVIEQTRMLTPVAGWRLKQGDTLADALGYGAFRLKIDTAVLNNQPVEAKEVVRVLTEDPTLNDETRVAYIRHLMAFALALDDIEEADLLPAAARGNPDLERAIINQLDGALASGKGDRVYRRLRRWLAIPGGFRGMYWVELLHRAALANASGMVKADDAASLADFLRELHVQSTTAPGDHGSIAAIVPSVVEAALPLAPSDANLAGLCFAMASATFPPDRWHRVLTLKPMMAQLPAGMQRLVAYLRGDEQAELPHGVLLQAVEEYTGVHGVQWRYPLVIRLAELAITNRHLELLDAQTLDALSDAASTEWGKLYTNVLLWIVRSVSTDEQLPQIEAAGRPALLRILLARGSHIDLVGELNRHNRLFYPADKLGYFGGMVHDVFSQTPLPVTDVSAALNALATRGVKPLPLAMAYFGALEQHQWPPELEKEALELTRLIAGNRLIAEAIQPDSLIQLLAHYVERRDDPQAERIADLLPAAAARRGEVGLSIMTQMYTMLNWDERMIAMARNALRRYIRRLPETAAPGAIQRLGRELGESVRVMLDATLLLWRMMAGESLGDYAYTLHTTAEFLHDTALPYLEKGRAPGISTLISDLDSLSGGLSEEDRAILCVEIVETGRLIAQMANAHRQAHARETQEDINNLLMGRGAAYSLVDVFRSLGGYFSRGRRASLRGDRAIADHPLANRASHLLAREVQQINRLLRAALAAIPAPGAVEKDRRFVISAAALHSEVESLWEEISLHEQRALVRNLAIDLQRISEVVLRVTEKYDVKVLQDDSGLARKLEANRQRPENAIELYRFISGYFGRRSR